MKLILLLSLILLGCGKPMHKVEMLGCINSCVGLHSELKYNDVYRLCNEKAKTYKYCLTRGRGFWFSNDGGRTDE